jgi:hypothetical protein
VEGRLDSDEEEAGCEWWLCGVEGRLDSDEDDAWREREWDRDVLGGKTLMMNRQRRLLLLIFPIDSYT